MDEQPEYEREVGRRVIADHEQRRAEALGRQKRSRRFSLIAAVFAVVGILVMVFITPIPLASWAAIGIAGCLVVQ